MKIIEKATGKILADILTNHGFTLGGACDFMGIPIMRTAQDYENENGYDIEELELTR